MPGSVLDAGDISEKVAEQDPALMDLPSSRGEREGASPVHRGYCQRVKAVLQKKGSLARQWGQGA